ncbi:Aklanonic acid methyltransferase DauC [Colletotrichum orbiculare MAFF 240422]|uniref:Aklanonic acid methyltransferase DauC n=1 Tax=Colletotrichum orbiculare (strain 104-T / ATCC 96160 / CBS 514.97 / LARS 414 / MAFF 240422) TaxID=1213857 RepID=N4VBY2_COLOR|nr:Aklanonic acid methyltransferase DauC [Colletotrichum orbiculare MAFF 240422]
MYTARADRYENSFHPDYTKRFMAIADIQAGERVLVLACGTGLEIFIATEQVGEEGEIVGVDITDAMLAKARQKKEQLKPDAKTFDVILCSSAFVLFDNPESAVVSWRNFLKPVGRLLIDITHEDNLKVGLLLERAAKRLGLKFPSNRTWIKDENSFKQILERAGYQVEKVELMDRLTGQGDTYYSADQIEEHFERITGTPLTVNLATEEFRDKTRALFREEWEKDAVNGMILNVDAVYLYVASRT